MLDINQQKFLITLKDGKVSYKSFFGPCHKIDLGIVKYSDRKLHCCFNIYQRPKNGLNPRPDFTLKDITIIEHRRKKGEYKTGKNLEIKPNFDYAMCNWGNGSLGKQPELTTTNMFSLCDSLTHDSIMNIINNLYDRKTAGYSVVDLPLGEENLNRISDEEKSIAINKGWTLS